MAQTPTPQNLIDAVVRGSADDQPLSRLRTAAALARSVNEITDAALGYFVDQARRAGRSWSEIGHSLGVSKQAAQQRQSGRAGIVMPPVTFERFTERARVVLAKVRWWLGILATAMSEPSTCYWRSSANPKVSLPSS